MPVPPIWFPRLPQILATVRSLPSNEINREQITRVFGIKRRTALLLMKRLNPKMVGGRWRIERARLVTWLEGQSRDADQELQRRDHMTRGLIKADIALPRPPGTFLSVAATEEMRAAAVQGLPEGVSLAAGELTVKFATLAELAEKLLQTGLALDKNLDHYANLAETTADPRDQTELEIERLDAEYFKNWRP